jgi:hypothetical protein
LVILRYDLLYKIIFIASPLHRSTEEASDKRRLNFQAMDGVNTKNKRSNRVHGVLLGTSTARAEALTVHPDPRIISTG